MFTEEHEDSKSGYSIDMRVEGKHAGADCVWAVEVDGPSHFLQVRTIPSRAVLPREEGTRRVQLVREEGTRRVQLVREGAGGGVRLGARRRRPHRAPSA